MLNRPTGNVASEALSSVMYILSHVNLSLSNDYTRFLNLQTSTKVVIIRLLFIITILYYLLYI